MFTSSTFSWSRSAAVVPAAAMLALLSACGGGSSSASGAGSSGVASLQSPGSKSPSSKGHAAKVATDERPLVRSDMSQEDRDRLDRTYQTCLEQLSGRKGTDATQFLKQQSAASKKVAAACLSKEPEEVWERAKRLDPKYADELRTWVKCLNTHGIPSEVDDGLLGFKNGLPDDPQGWVDKCQKTAFGA